MKKKTRNRLILVTPLVALIIVGLYFGFVREVTVTLSGVTYIKKEEEKSIRDLQKTLTAIRNKEQLMQIEKGKITNFDLFHDYVIYGDSRVCGFYEYGFLPQSRIFAKTGDGISSIPNWDEQLAALKPSHIYFLYGINELDEIILDKGADYKEEYTQMVRKVMSSLPEAHIYICSIIPVSENVKQKDYDKSYADVPAYNRIIKSICEENGWTYVDMSTFFPGPQYYQSDGIHLKKEYYPIWAERLIAATED